MKFEIKNRWSGAVQFACTLSAEIAGMSYSAQLGFAVKAARESGANLCDANLRDANLRDANLRDANLCGADLCDADLRDANLCGANLCGADLCGANLCGADLCGADLCGADLCGADLCGANLCGADLCGANLCGANLCDAKSAELVIAKTRILPDGDLIGWKKCRHGVIVKLRIPEAAKRSHAFGRKCRAEYADVLEVFNGTKGISIHDRKTEYVAGARILPDEFDTNWINECSSGVHFFITRLEAEDYL
jgi:hypothetical protein